jgi:hypothetical protein
MDFIKNAVGGDKNEDNQQSNQSNQEKLEDNSNTEQKSEGSGGFLGGLGDKLNNAAGGGAQGEKNEDYLDKGELILLVKFF